ncbi:MAG: manganese efflux pump MntP family protein [Chitinispirillales bacterium]|jgi:putative Mn2+ efflux pump MntP|nr:manganese efflux pump MntP family protein [Chitinispirillales bacterium]
MELLLIALGLSADAFAVSLSCGASEKKLPVKFALNASLAFGFFQSAMPVLGYFFGNLWAKYVFAFGHWISFAMLVLVGGKMIFEAIKNENLNHDKSFSNIKNVLFLALATSIDAFAVGVSFSFDSKPILISALLIGIITFFVSFAGFFIGRKFGDLFGEKAEILGGTALIAVGVKIVVSRYVG